MTVRPSRRRLPDPVKLHTKRNKLSTSPLTTDRELISLHCQFAVSLVTILSADSRRYESIYLFCSAIAVYRGFRACFGSDLALCFHLVFGLRCDCSGFAWLLLLPWVLPAAWGCFAVAALVFLFAWLFPLLLVVPLLLLLLCCCFAVTFAVGFALSFRPFLYLYSSTLPGICKMGTYTKKWVLFLAKHQLK